MRELRHPKAGGNRRLWLFQTCTEFGFCVSWEGWGGQGGGWRGGRCQPSPPPRSADPSCRDAACPFSRFQTLRAQLSLCADVFGIAPARVRAAVAFTNTFYGAAHPDTHRVLFVNGTARIGVTRGTAASHGAARRNTVPCVVARHGMARGAAASCGAARRNAARCIMARHAASHGTAWCITARHGAARFIVARHSVAWGTTASHGAPWRGTVWQGDAVVG